MYRDMKKIVKILVLMAGSQELKTVNIIIIIMINFSGHVLTKYRTGRATIQRSACNGRDYPAIQMIVRGERVTMVCTVPPTGNLPSE